jgi:YggT family protein
LNAIIFLIETFSRLYLLTFLLRILLQLARADFYNPISQFIVTVTNPLVVPARRIIPSIRRFDFPTFVVLFALQTIVLVVIFALRGGFLPFVSLLWLTLLTLATMTLWTYIFCLLVWVIMSWVGQGGYSPFAQFLGQLVNPLLRPVRRVCPDIGGLDISPLITTIFLMAGIYALGDLTALIF